jgi:hypothetical protein
MMRWSRRWPNPLPLAAFVLILVSTSAAQVTTRFVEGTVIDENNRPIAGAVVQVKNMVSLQIRSFITAKDGNTTFPD